MNPLRHPLDRRTRRDADVRTLEFEAFCRDELPALLECNGELAGRGAAAWELRPLAFEVDALTHSLFVRGGRLAAAPGVADGAAVARLSAENFSDLFQDLVSTLGLILGGLVEMRSGGFDDFIEWQPVLSALIDGRPAWEPGLVTFRGRDGSPLDLQRGFRIDDDEDEMAHFLAEAGFLHIRGLFTTEEMAEIGADIERAIPSYAPDDGRSWWAKTQSGESRVVRLQCFQQHSARTRALIAEERFLHIASLGRSGYEPCTIEGDNFVEALVKPIGVVEGISDVPWHNDCALGRHAYRCSSMTVGISVTGADEGSGELGVVAGSHRIAVPQSGADSRLDLPRIPLPTQTGDVTVHLSCTLHMSRPPTTRERSVLYTNFSLPPRPGDPEIYSDKLSAIREGAPGRMGAQSRDDLGRAGSFDL
jgi:hypothetical protein